MKIGYIYRVLIVVFSMIDLANCAIFGPSTLEVGINSDKKSIVIMPIKDFEYGQVVWGKVGDNSSKEYFQIDIANVGNFDDGVAFINSEFLIMSADPGVYYIKGVRIQNDKGYDLVQVREYNSTLGNIFVQKFKYNLFDKQDSYYVINHDFANAANDYNEVGTIIIYENETILMPALWIDIALVENSCNELYLMPNEYFRKLYKNRTNNGIRIGEWICPIKAFSLSIKSKSINYFLSQITPNKKPKIFSGVYLSNRNEKLLQKKLEKIVVRDFEKGILFKKSKKIKSFYEDTEQYIIYGDR
ncbi:MAG: hypothetical protein LBS39_01965 [Campylobacteraceae bacterium]|jgi:hypothetical protein|nr:hypothetical protein [Campylobacteraceae bacterium]